LDAVSSVGGRPAVSACSSSTYAVASPAPPPAGGSGGSTIHTRRAWLECARIAALTARTAAGAPRDASQPHSPKRSGGWWAACASPGGVASPGSAAAAAAAGRRACVEAVHRRCTCGAGAVHRRCRGGAASNGARTWRGKVGWMGVQGGCKVRCRGVHPRGEDGGWCRCGGAGRGEGNTDLLDEAPQRGETLGRRRALLRAGIGREHEHAQPEPPWLGTGLGLGLG